MPNVNGVEFPYTPEGMAAARDYQQALARAAAQLRAQDEAEVRSRAGGAWNTASRLHREPTLNVDYGPPPPRMQFRSVDDYGPPQRRWRVPEEGRRAAYSETYPTAMRIPENLEEVSRRASEFPTPWKAYRARRPVHDEALDYAHPTLPPVLQRWGREDAIRDAVDLDLAEAQRQRALLQQFGSPEQRAADIFALEALRSR